MNDNVEMSVTEQIARALARCSWPDTFDGNEEMWMRYAVAALIAQRKAAETMTPLIYRTAMLSFLDTLV